MIMSLAPSVLGKATQVYVGRVAHNNVITKWIGYYLLMRDLSATRARR